MGLVAILAVSAAAASRRILQGGADARTSTTAGIPNDPDIEQHRLGVFRPVGKDAHAPVIFFVHEVAGRLATRTTSSAHLRLRDHRRSDRPPRRGGGPHQLPVVAEGQAPRPHQGRGPRLRLDAPQHRQVRRPARPGLRLRPLRRRPPRLPAGDRRELPTGGGAVRQRHPRRDLDQRHLRRGRLRFQGVAEERVAERQRRRPPVRRGVRRRPRGQRNQSVADQPRSRPGLHGGRC